MTKSISGELRHLALPDVLQVITQSSMTGFLKITTEDGVDGRLVFTNGALVDARTTHLVGDDAATLILTWKKGDFNFIPDPYFGETTVTIPIEKLILDHALRQDEDIASVGHSISGTSHIHLCKEATLDDTTQLNPDEWVFLSHIVEGISLSQIIHELGMTIDTARVIVAKFIKLGIIRISHD